MLWTSPTVDHRYGYSGDIDDILVLFDRNGETYNAYSYLKDPLRTTEALVDEDASIVESCVYEVYGLPTINTGDGDWFDGDETTGTSPKSSRQVVGRRAETAEENLIDLS